MLCAALPAKKMLEPYYIQGLVEAGCDEAGRGPLAGSVFAAAVVWRPDEPYWEHEDLALLNDSKRLSERMRYHLRTLIERYAWAWAVAEVTTEEIDTMNILNASITAMQRALALLKVQPQNILVDGNRWKPYIPEGQVLAIPAQTVVKGDARYMSIAAASILAKTYRDDYMRLIDQEYPQYGWKGNKGYPTRAHYEAIREYGLTPYHRKSFTLSK